MGLVVAAGLLIIAGRPGLHVRRREDRRRVPSRLIIDRNCSESPEIPWVIVDSSD
jgi:riboflavin biosynthesis pyrimidine reductase